MSKRKLIKERHIQDIFLNQKRTAVKRGLGLPSYTKEELTQWCLAQPRYHALHAAWVTSGFIRTLAPSVDRKDDYKGYSLDNIQLMTAKQNLDKAFKDCYDGVNTKRSRAVDQLDSVGNIIKSFPSCNMAGRAMGAINGSTIVQACLGKIRTAYGYTWQYSK